MKIHKKCLIIIAGAGFVGLGLLFFIQTPNEKNEGNEDQINVTMESPEKQRPDIVKVENPKKVTPSSKKANLIKTHFNDNHIEYGRDSVEIFDEMEIFDSSSAGIHLTEHFDLLENTESGSQEKQDESLEKMRETPEVYVTKLTESYDEVERLNFLARYKIVYIMENLESPHAIPFLSEIAHSESPEEIAPYEGDGHIDEVHHENLIRMRAVGGLYNLANDGNNSARNALFDTILDTKDHTVKNDAIWSYLSTSKDLETDIEYLKTVLPDEDHQFLTIKVSDIKNIQKQVEISEIEEVQEQVESINENEHLI